MQIAKNTIVSFDYTLSNPQGETLDSSIGGHPLSYLHGVGGIIPGLEKAMDGKSVGDAFQLVIPPEQAYGAPNPEMIQPVSRKAFGDVQKIAPGMEFEAKTPEGPRLVKIVAVKDDTITVDANHPLAGQTLHFDVKVVSVRNASPEELSHGHAHGPGGHHHH